MKAAVLEKTNSPILIEDVALAAPGVGEVKVRVEAAGVCHSDYHYVSGDLAANLPLVLGHEGVGRVIEVGSSVTDLAVGDRVVFTWRPRCGDCEFCSAGRPNLCVLGRVQATTGGLPDGTARLRRQDGGPLFHLMGVSCFAEECVVSARSAVRISDDLPTEIAAIIGCAVVTGVGAALNLMAGSAGSPVVVMGAGGVGLSAVMGLNLVGASPIVVVDTVVERLERAQAVGATHTIDASRSDVRETLAQLLPKGALWAVDAVGAPTTMEQAYAALSVRGTLLVLGLGQTDATFRIPINLLVQQERQVRGSLYGSANPLVDLPRILNLYSAGRLPLDLLVGRVYGLDDVNEAFADLRNGAVGRSVIVPWARDAEPVLTSVP